LKKNEIIAIIANELPAEQLRAANVYVYKERLPAGISIGINQQEIVMGKPSYLLFADLEPGANWAHRCRYFIVDEDGQHSAIDSSLPPEMEHYRLLQKGGESGNWSVLTSMPMPEELL